METVAVAVCFVFYCAVFYHAGRFCGERNMSARELVHYVEGQICARLDAIVTSADPNKDGTR